MSIVSEYLGSRYGLPAGNYGTKTIFGFSNGSAQAVA
jgi:hypothetical protein